MQEMLKYVHDEVQLFGSARQILISKIEEMIEKEKEVIIMAYETGDKYKTEIPGANYYNETFNTKER